MSRYEHAVKTKKINDGIINFLQRNFYHIKFSTILKNTNNSYDINFYFPEYNLSSILPDYNAENFAQLFIDTLNDQTTKQFLSDLIIKKLEKKTKEAIQDAQSEVHEIFGFLNKEN